MKKIFLLLWGFVLIACSGEQKTGTPMKKETYHAIKTAFMDTTVRPQDDFYNFVNGRWQKTAEIPADRSRWGAFSELRKNTDSALLALLTNKDKSYAQGTDQRKALDYFASIMDTATRNKLGFDPAMDFWKKIDGVDSPETLLAFMVENEPYFGSPFVGFYVGPHMKQSGINVLYLGSGALGLPDRDYYLSDDADAKDKRAKYVAHIARMWGYTPEKSRAKEAAANIMRIETAMATAIMSKEERRKPENRYNPRKIKDLYAEAPSFDWKKYIAAFHLETDSLILTQPKYLPAFEQILKTEKPQAIRDYLHWTYLRSVAGRLTTDISKANWEFYGRTLHGTPKRRPLDERALGAVNGGMGDALGQIYVENYFPPESKKAALELVHYLQRSYKQRIDNLKWMSSETKEKAKQKVDKLLIKIGYPDKWKSYADMNIKAPDQGGGFFANAMAVSEWYFRDMVSRLGKPVDRGEWHMNPQTVNAYYNASNNEIVFPAAILQAPFFDARADAAVNFGGIGAVIGHEISHGFDDQGAKYDPEGNFHMWWKPEDFANFQKLGNRLADQYSAIEVLPGLHINGQYTLGENIGDLGGVFASFTALQMYWKDKGKPGKIDGFTPEQRYFISWATVWRTKMRKEALINQIKTDPHSPGMIRAYQPIRNMEAFHRAFDIKEGDKMYLDPQQRVIIW